MNKRKILALLALCLLLVSLTGCGAKEEITADFIGQKLELVSELVTAKMTYHGVYEYKGEGIPYLTLKEFLMVYHAEAKAWIDLSQLEIDVTENDVTIRFPQEVSVDIHILPESLKFYDSKIAIFNPESKEDAAEAMELAEADILENGGIGELKETAMDQAVLLVESFVQEIIGEKTLTIVR